MRYLRRNRFCSAFFVRRTDLARVIRRDIRSTSSEARSIWNEALSALY